MWTKIKRFNKLTILIVLISLAILMSIVYLGILIFNQYQVINVSRLSNNKIEEMLPKTQEIPKKLTASEVIEKNGNYIVQVFCSTRNGDVQGSGVLLGKDNNDQLLILTNYHVIENLETFSSGVPSCFIKTHIVEFNEYYYAQPTFYPDQIDKENMEIIDFALLTVKEEPKIENTQIANDGTKTVIDQTNFFLLTNNFPEICTSDQLKIGEDLIVLGFPSVSGIDIPGFGSNSKFTATEGIISENIDSVAYYFNTSAKIEHGNSGGGSFLKNAGCFAGMPSFVVSGEIESLGRILNANKLQSEFLYKILKK